MTGKNDLRVSEGPARRLTRDAPEKPDEAHKLDDDARNGPLEEDEEAGVSLVPVRSLRKVRNWADTHMPPKKHTVPRHFSRREKK